jgi:hypothetical protein
MLGLRLLRVAAWAGLLWFLLHPSDWSPVAIYLLRGVCFGCLAVSLRQYALQLASPMAWVLARKKSDV